MEKSFERIKNKSAMLADNKKKPLIKDEYKKFEAQLQQSIMTNSILDELDDDIKRPQTTQEFH